MASHHRSSTFALAALACAAGLALPARAADNLVTNGSFQFSSSGPTGWSFLQPIGEFWKSFEGHLSPDGGDYFGIQDLDTSTSRSNVGGITQTISGLQAGRQYELSFYSMSNHTQRSPEARQQWRVSFGDQVGASDQTFASPNPVWVQSHLNFTATAAVQTLTFVAEFLPGSYPEILNIDGIVLTAAAVPEPAPPWLLGAGLLAIAGVTRRKLR